MKIVKFQAENFKRLKAVEIIPDEDGNIVFISGRNAQGKTSVLDAIWLALGGGPAAKGTPTPVRDGEDKAFVTLELDDLIVTRTWTSAGKTALKVTKADGAAYSSPQTMLDELVGRMCFDPLAFARLDEKKQLAELLSLVDLPFNVDELAAKRQGIYDERTNVNRDLASAKARLASTPQVAGADELEEVSSQSVLEELSDARRVVSENASIRSHLEQLDQTARNVKSNVSRLEAELEEARKLEISSSAAFMEFAAKCADLTDPDVAALEQKLAGLEESNQAARAAKAYGIVASEVDELGAQSDELTRELEALDASKTDALSQAAMPIEGLAFDENGVTYQGVPFSQCSAAEQLRVSIAMAMAMTPEVRVIRITDGSLLDSDSLQLIANMAAEHDYQIWIEVVDESGEIGVVIEDGSTVASRETVAV